MYATFSASKKQIAVPASDTYYYRIYYYVYSFVTIDENRQ